MGSEAGVIEKSGAYYSWKGERIAQGRDNACKWMLENPQAAEEIRPSSPPSPPTGASVA